MENTYTFKQIIFALRQEYIEIEKQLSELNKYINVSNKVEHFYFYIAGNPCELFLYLDMKRNLLEKLEVLLGTYIYGTTTYNVTAGIKDRYYYNKQEICSILYQEELNKKIEKIVQTDFFKNIVANNHTSIPCNENEINHLIITSQHIGLINGFNGNHPYLDYYPIYDELVMINKEKNITFDDIFKLLSLSINRNYLNNYHHKILDNYEEKEIDIDIDDNFNSNVAKLKIIEEPKRLILKPKKNTKKNV